MVGKYLKRNTYDNNEQVTQDDHLLSCTCCIKNIEIDNAMIYFDDDNFFIFQNHVKGTQPTNNHSSNYNFKYSWVLLDYTVKNLRILKQGKIIELW